MRFLAKWLFALLACAQITPASAEDYPTKPITIVTGYAAGAASDMLARTLAEALQADWKQPVVIDNRPGSSGNIAAAYVARSNPDGYTLMIAADPVLTTNNFLFKSLPFDPLTSFAPITNVAGNVMVLAVHPDVPVTTVAEFISYVKQRPSKVSFGSSGSGTPHHLAGELLMQQANIKLVHIPYKGSGQTINDLLGGHIPSAVLSLSSAKPLHDAGKIRIIGVIESKRYVTLPDVPTIAETLPGFELPSWLALVAPAGTPQAVVDKLNAVAVKTLRSPSVMEKLAGYGLIVIASTPAELANSIKSGLDVRGSLIKASGIQPE